MRSAKRLLRVLAVVSLGVGAILTFGRGTGRGVELFGTPARAQVQLVDKEELRSGGALPGDLEATQAGPTSPTGTGRPPRVGPNAAANGPQAFFPNGLVGRSETTIAGTDDGQLLIAGWNDAQGFCGAPFGNPCPQQVPHGLSGYGFSVDGGLTWIDGGGPDVFNNILSRGDPWLDRGGFDGQTFFYANLAIDAPTGASLGVSVHRGRLQRWRLRVGGLAGLRFPCQRGNTGLGLL